MNLNVIVGLAYWGVGGVQSFVGNLVRGLLCQGAQAHVIWTCHHRPDQRDLAPPPNLPIVRLPVAPSANLRQRWQAMIDYLEQRAPCIYLPNDFLHTWIALRLSQRVRVVGNLHSDCALQYELCRLLGPYWNAVVSGSAFMAGKAVRECPAVADRIVEIPYGVEIPAYMPERAPAPGRPLKILYAGRLDQSDKRVFDLPKIVQALHVRGVPAVLTIQGQGKDEAALKAASQDLVAKGLIRFLGVVSEDEVPRTYEGNDVFVLTSNFEGKPLSLVEAMGRGCVPVVTDVPSGVPELVREGDSGYRVPVGDINAFADRLAALHADPGLRLRLARNAFDVVDRGGYRIEEMVQRYRELFERVTEEAESGAYRRASGRVVLPPSVREHAWWVPTWKDSLPRPIRVAVSFCKRLVTRASRRGPSEAPPGPAALNA